MTGPYHKPLPSAVPRPLAAKAKLLEFEGLRGWLAWWVVVGHSLDESGWSASFLPTIGKLFMGQMFAVRIFIILSGFVITLLLDRQNRPYREFIATRAFRIFPLYYVLLVFGACLLPWLRGFYGDYIAHLGNPSHLQHLYASWASHAEHWRAHLAVCFTGLHGAVPQDWLPHAQSAFVSQAWSISLEWQFYLVAPLLWLALKNRRGLLLLGVGFYAVLGLRHHFTLGAWASFLPQSLEFFAIGSVSYFAYKYIRFGPPGSGNYARALLAVILLVIGCVPFFRSAVFVPWPWYPVINEGLSIGIWMIVLTLAIALQHAPDHRFVRLLAFPLTNRVAAFLGRISYSTYLCHYFVIFGLQWLMLQFAPASINKWTMAAVLLTAGSALTFGFSLLLHRFVETPGIAWGKKFTSR